MLITSTFLFESSPYVPKVLLDIEESFKKIHEFVLKYPKNMIPDEYLRELEKKISVFTDIERKNVFFRVDYTYEYYMNAFISPIYKASVFSQVFHIIKRLFNYDEMEKKITPEELSKLEKVKENSKSVDRIYLLFTHAMFYNLDEKELTACLLHEIGHIFYRVNTVLASLTDLLLIKLPKYISVLIWGINYLITKRPNYTLSAYLIIFILLSGALASMKSQSEEKSADKYASKYGYGDDFGRAHRKMIGTSIPNDNIFLEKIKVFARWLFTTFYKKYEHPDDVNRLLKNKKDVLKEFAKLYPQYNEESFKKYIDGVFETASGK